MASTITTNHVATGPQLAGPANYMSKYDFTNKYHPELLPEMAELYGGGITGFLRAYGSEVPVSADQIYWGEGGRLRKLERNVSLTSATGVFTCEDNTVQRKGAMILVMDPATGKKQTGLVTSVSSNDRKSYTAQPYDKGAWDLSATGLNVMTIGSEFLKGTDRMDGSLVTDPSIYSTSLSISKDVHEMDDSTICNATWLQAPDDSLYWYHTEIEEFRRRFDEFQELKLVLGVKIAEDSPLKSEGYNSTEGLFEAIGKRGGSVTGIPETMDDWISVCKYLDKEEGEKRNMLFTTTDMSFAIDKMLADMGQGRATPDWGSFENNASMFKNLGFDGFGLGGYEFMKKSWKLLNDATGLSPESLGVGGVINGMLMPAGSVSTQIGTNAGLVGAETKRVKYLNVLYKAGNGIDRRLQTGFYGSRMNNGTEDVTGVTLLSEASLLLAGANRWMLFKG